MRNFATNIIYTTVVLMITKTDFKEIFLNVLVDMGILKIYYPTVLSNLIHS